MLNHFFCLMNCLEFVAAMFVTAFSTFFVIQEIEWDEDLQDNPGLD